MHPLHSLMIGTALTITNGQKRKAWVYPRVSIGPPQGKHGPTPGEACIHPKDSMGVPQACFANTPAGFVLSVLLNVNVLKVQAHGKRRLHLRLKAPH